MLRPEKHTPQTLVRGLREGVPAFSAVLDAVIQATCKFFLLLPQLRPLTEQGQVQDAWRILS